MCTASCIKGETQVLWNYLMLYTFKDVSSPLFIVSNTILALYICKEPATEAFCSKRWWDLLYQIMLQPYLMRKKDTSLKTLQILFLCHPHAHSLLSHLERQKCVLLLCAADHPYPSLCCWKSGGITPSAGCSAAAARLPTARSRISPRPPFPFRHSARRTAHWVPFGCSAQWKTWPQDWESKAPCWKSGTCWDVGVLMVKIWP